MPTFRSALVLAAAYLGVLLALGCQGCSSKVDVGDLLVSGRDGWQRPAQVVAALEVQPGQRVAEIGAGDGYWLPWLSQAVGAEGVVYAVEVEPEKVAALVERVHRDGLANVRVVHGRYDDPLLPDGQIDLAMTCLTYHHIEERVDYFRRLQADLAPGGRVAHLDDRDDLGVPLRWLPSAGHTTNAAAMDAEMESAGYRRTRRFDLLLVQTFHVYAPATSLAAQDEG
ncbi:MAG: class I SAM-dependent methyltransferase [Myxococcota bacterium]